MLTGRLLFRDAKNHLHGDQGLGVEDGKTFGTDLLVGEGHGGLVVDIEALLSGQLVVDHVAELAGEVEEAERSELFRKGITIRSLIQQQYIASSMATRSLDGCK